MFSHLFQRKPLPTERFSFSHQGRVLNVTLRRRSNAKRLTMRVRDGGLSLTTPTDVSAHDARAFIRNHFDWVDRQLASEDRALNDTIPSDHNGAPSIWYHGDITPVYLYRDPAHHGRAHIRHDHGAILITMAGAPVTSRHQTITSSLRPTVILEKWLRSEAKSAITAALDDVLPLINQPPVPLSIRDQKTRWGSCSTTRRLSFNWRLIMAPPACLHYLVVHEAAHLVHHDHSPRFWGLVEDLMPDFAVHQDWLKSHQQALFTGIDRRLAGLKPTTTPPHDLLSSS